MRGGDMSQELRNCEMEIRQAIRNSKLAPKTFKDDVEKSLDFAGRFFSNHPEKIRLLIDRGHYNEAVEELEKVRFKLL
jgi:hypothetical protein